MNGELFCTFLRLICNMHGYDGHECGEGKAMAAELRVKIGLALGRSC